MKQTEWKMTYQLHQQIPSHLPPLLHLELLDASVQADSEWQLLALSWDHLQQGRLGVTKIPLLSGCHLSL